MLLSFFLFVSVADAVLRVRQMMDGTQHILTSQYASSFAMYL